MDVLQIIGYAGYVIGAAVILASKTKTDNIKDLKERVEILEKERKYDKELLQTERAEAAKKHVANREAIAKLQGQVEIYKDLQLKSIAETNQRILEVLSKSALIAQTAADSGGVLVHTKEEHPLDVKVTE